VIKVLGKLRDFLVGAKSEPVKPQRLRRHIRSKAGQEVEAAAYGLGAPVPRMDQALMLYATNPWVNLGVSMIAELCAQATLKVQKRSNGDYVANHPIYDLLSDFGRPNDGDDVIEFLERHYSNFLLTKNSYWLWISTRGGTPDEVYQLDPRAVRVIPGTGQRISHYEYMVMGEVYALPPISVTHFKGYHSMNMYHGLPIYEPGRHDYEADHDMASWNAEYFDGPSIPDGVWVVPKETTDAQIEEFEDKLEMKHAGKRRSAVVRAEPGGAAWLDAGLRHQDLDFIEGRRFTRQVALEVLHVPLGYLSEASTEAHAKVSERKYLSRCWQLSRRTASKLTVDIMPFYDGLRQTNVEFEDVRIADWSQELAKWQGYKIREELGREVPEG